MTFALTPRQWGWLVILAVALSFMALIIAGATALGLDAVVTAMFSLAILTLALAALIAQRERTLAVGMARYQIDEKIAVMFSYADEAHYRLLQPPPGLAPALQNPASEFYDLWLERIVTDINAVGRIAHERSSDQDERLRTAEALLVEQLRRSRYDDLAARVDAAFRSAVGAPGGQLVPAQQAAPVQAAAVPPNAEIRERLRDLRNICFTLALSILVLGFYQMVQDALLGNDSPIAGTAVAMVVAAGVVALGYILALRSWHTGH